MGKKPEQEGSLSLKDILMQVEGVSSVELDRIALPEVEGATVREITIERNDDGENEAWDKALASKELLRHFGPLALQAYGDRENPPVYNEKSAKSRKEAISYTAEAELGFAHKVLVVERDGQVISFLALEEGQLDNGEKFGNVSLGVTSPEYQHKGVGTALMKDVFQRKYDVVTGISQARDEVSVAMNVAQGEGYASFFCGNKEGVPGDKGSAEEQARVNAAYEYMRKELIEGEATITGPMEEGFVVLAQENDPIRPLTEKEIAQMPAGPLKDTFEKDFWPVQKNHGKDTVLGLFAAISRKE